MGISCKELTMAKMCSVYLVMLCYLLCHIKPIVSSLITTWTYKKPKNMVAEVKHFRTSL